MKIRELIDELENFVYEFGDLEVAINRNGRSYPVFIKASGAFPAHTNQLSENSGYFEYKDDAEKIDLSAEEIPCPNCGTIMDYESDWDEEKFICPNCGTEVSGNTVREEFFGDDVNLCILND